MVIPVSGGFGIVRYRFCGREDIDVLYDENWRVISINPTFTQDGFGLTLLLHRRQIFTVPVTIPLKKE